MSGNVSLLHCRVVSTGHLTEADNDRLLDLSCNYQEYGSSEWIHFTGQGYLIRLYAWSKPVLKLKEVGLSKDVRRLIVSLVRRDAIDMVHFDCAGSLVEGFAVHDW
ncbi:DUF5983 family protein [Dickeya fangzhongdai]|uniref:DUF5983 family protein n=1 Tax=Dickeya TaxID=204037 RepID=UPI00137D639E|nr:MULTISPECIES: DUF5983 family protein [Dickeya]MZG45121.1 hypothetical protein [Dickeya dianthicola]WOY02024.1 DUF5983 family protein [Dickeya fangzhongdai]